MIPKMLPAALAAAVAVIGAGAAPAGQDSELTDVAKAWLAERGRIVFAGQLDYPPFEFVDGATGEYTGMGVELIRWIATEFGFTAAFAPMSFAEAQNAVIEGSADAISGIFRSPGREPRFDFSADVFPVPALIFARADSADIAATRDLEGRKVAVQRGDFAIEYLAAAGVAVEYVYADDFKQALALLAAGAADAMIGDEQVVRTHIRLGRLEGAVKSVSGPLYVGRDCIAVAKGDAIPLSIIDAGIRRAKSSGTLSTIYMKWTGLPLVDDGEGRNSWNAAGIFVSAAAAMVGAALAGIAAAKRWMLGKVAEAKADLEATIGELRAENGRLSATAARLRRDIEERSRLEEEKRRIDAEAAARRVEELTRLAITSALESTRSGSEAGPEPARGPSPPP